MRSRSPGTIAARLVLVATTLAAAACGPAPPGTPGTVPPTGVAPTGAPATVGPSAPVTPEPTPAPSQDVPPSPPSPSSGSVREDPSLLAILPPDVGGVAVAQETTAFAEAASDPAFSRNVDAAAFAVAAGGEDLATVVVAHLRPGVWSDGFFRDWRDSYNDGACAQAGGVVGNAEAELGGRTTYITTCAGGLTVYHAYLEERGIVVSLISVGGQRLGEQLMRDLRP